MGSHLRAKGRHLPYGITVLPATQDKPPPPVGAGGGYMFSGRLSVPLSVRPSVRASVRESRGSFMFLRYLQYMLTDFRQLLSLVHLRTEMN